MKVHLVELQEFYNENKKILESSNVNFLIGSGISSHILATLTDMEDLLEYNNDVVKHSTTTVNRIQIEALLYWKFFNKSIFPIYSSDLDDLEEHKNIVGKLLNNIYKIIERKKDSNLEKQINLFTSNYDLFFEESMERVDLYYNDGFVGRIFPSFDMSNYSISFSDMSNLNFKRVPKTFFNIVKIHGSLNWKTNYEKIGYDYFYIKKISKFYEDNFKIFDKEYKNLELFYKDEKFLNKSIEEKYEQIKSLFVDRKSNDYRNFIKSYKDIFSIVNPTKEKFQETLLNLNYHDMLRLYSTNLEREHVSLFVFGFSFADEHILKITERSLINPELKVVIFSYDHKSVEHYKKIFEKCNSSNSITIVYVENGKLDIYTLNSMYEKLIEELYQNEKVTKS